MIPTVSVPANLHHDLVRDCANGFIAIMSRHGSIGILLMRHPKATCGVLPKQGSARGSRGVGDRGTTVTAATSATSANATTR